MSSSKQERIYLITMKKKNNTDCDLLYNRYIKHILKKDDQLWAVKHEDQNECFFFIKKNTKIG